MDTTLVRRAFALGAALSAMTLVSGVGALAAPSVGEVTVQATGGVTPGFAADARPQQITQAADGLMWFLSGKGPVSVNRRNADGSISSFDAPAALSPGQITLGPDGNVWFSGFNPPGSVNKVTPDGTVTSYVGGVTPGLSAGNVEGIAAGPDGNVYFTEPFGGPAGRVGRITPDGVVTEFDAPVIGVQPRDLVAGPDGNIWFTGDGDSTGQIWKMTPDGDFTEMAVAGKTDGLPEGFPTHITVGPDGALWFAFDPGVGRITTAGDVTTSTSPDLEHPYYSGIAASCDSLWLSVYREDFDRGEFVQVALDGSITVHTDGISPDVQLNGIAVGPEGDMWSPDSLDRGRLLSIGTGCATPPPPPPSSSSTTSTTTAAQATRTAATPRFTG